MALKRATKSIPLSGGLVEEVDDFLLEPGGMQYVENGRFTKKDTVEKSRPFGTGVATGYSNYTVDVNGFWSDSNQRAALIGNNEVITTSDAGATWVDTTYPHELLGIEKVLSTAEQQGGMNYSCAPLGIHSGTTFGIATWIVAFERVNMFTVTNTREVVVQTYDLNGQLLDEMVEANANSPHCLSGGGVSGGGYCYMSTAAGNLIGYWVAGIGKGFVLTYNASHDIQQYCQYNNRSDERFDARNYGDLRMGHAAYMHDNNSALCAYWDPEEYQGLVAWKEEAVGQIQIKFMTSAVPSGTIYTLLTDVAGFTTHAMLDVTRDDDYVYLLYSLFNNIANTWTVRCMQWSISGTASNHVYTIGTGLDAVPVNGSVRKAPDGDIYIAYTMAQGFPTQTQQDTLGQHRVQWERVSGGNWATGAPALQDQATLYSHRLCSNVQPDKDSMAGIVVQQWDNWNPSDQATAGAEQDEYTPTFAGKKPVTSVLLMIGDVTNENTVCATFDAGQSKAVPFSSDEQSIHKGGDLWYFSNGSPGGDDYNRWHYGNRTVLVAEDTLYFLDRTAAPAWVSWSDPKAGARTTLFGGASRFSVYHVNSSIRVHSASLPDGLVLGTSCPAWFDARGETVMSAGPLDSPEITAVAAAAGDGCTYTAYSDLLVANEEAKVYQAVWLFTDSAGRVHRSAPSVPLYVGNLKAGSTTTTTVDVYVTAPVTLQRERGTLFVEIYEAWPGGVPQLAAMEKVAAGQVDGSFPIKVEVPTNDSPDGVLSVDFIDYRTSKALYTAGNVLAADPWPNFSSVVQSGRRLFGLSIADPSSIYYSKTFEQNVAPEFSASLVVTLGNQEITALGTIDDKLIAFTRTGMWMIYGTGPDNTGANGDFFVEQLTHKVGCIDQSTILTYADGIAFYSNTTQEFHVLGRDLQLVDVGETIKDISARVTTHYDSVVDAGAHELQWYVYVTPGTEYQAAGGTTSPAQPPRPWLENVVGYWESVLVYNYKYQKWSVRTLQEAFSNGVITNGVAIVGGKPGIVSQSYTFFPTSETAWASAETMKWETPWIKVNQLQDFGRFYGATFLGKYLSSWTDNGTGTEAGDLQVTVKYDYEGFSGSTDVARFRANKDFNPANGDNLQFEVRPSRHKCQAIKFVIEEIATEAVEVWEPTYTTGRGYVLTGVDLHYGAKGGSSRLSAGRKK